MSEITHGLPNALGEAVVNGATAELLIGLAWS
jgi:hypothetical protein